MAGLFPDHPVSIADLPRLADLPAAPRKRREGESVDAARTRRNNEMIEAGTHPATRRPLLVVPDGVGRPTCGDCAQHRAIRSHRPTGYWHKCTISRLGLSHSAASDIRISWPACERFEPEDAP